MLPLPQTGAAHVTSMRSNFMGLGFSTSRDELAKLIETYKNVYQKSGHGNPDQLVMNFGGLEHHKVLSSLDLFGKYVIPVCK